MGLNNINSKSTWGQAASDINTNFTTIDSDLKKVKNATTRNKGYFSTSSELISAFPTASKGDIAYVGSSYPYDIWKWNGGSWANSGSTGGEESVNLGNYHTKEYTDAKLSELGSKKKNKSVGKNLFDKSSVKIGFWVGDNGDVNQYEELSLSDYIIIEPNTEYYIQDTNTGGASNVWYDKNINAISVAPKNGVCVSPVNAMYIRLSVDVKNLDIAMFFKGNSKSEYEPYTDNYDNEQIFGKIKKEVADLEMLLISKIEATTEVNKICNIKTGVITTNYSFSIQKLEISDNVEKIVMPSYWGSNSLGDYDGAAFYDKNMNYLGCVQGILGVMWSVSLTEIPLGMIPSGTKYIVSTSNEFKDSVGYFEKRENVAKELGELKEKVKNIEKDLPEDIKSYIEINYTLPTYQDEALGKNLFSKDGKIYGDFVYADGNSSSGNSWDNTPIYTSGNFATTYAIAVEGGKELTVSPTTNDAIYIAEYAADGSFVKSTKSLAPSTTIKLDLNTRYVRVPFVYSELNKLQVEYGSKATSYEEYKSKKVISLDELPKEVTDVVRKDDVEKVVGEQLKEQSYQGEIVLPKTLYNMVGRKSVLYISQFCKGTEKANIKLSATGAENVYSNSIIFQPQTSGVTYWSYIHLLKGARIVSSHGATINNIAAPSLQKNVKIMTIGDSLTDLGYYQSHLTRLLAENKVSCEWIGTQHRSEYDPVSFEAKSGGNLSYIATDYNVAKIIEVSGISVPPSTGYGSTEYTDGNGNKWRVNGHILTESNGVYSGKIRLVKYERDPNYEGGDAGDTTGSNLPSSGVLTKSNSGSGDGIIEYNLISTASENPLWNPQTKEVDWIYYFTTWGLDVPNIVILQFGYNEVEDMSNTNSEGVQIAASRLKYVIDKLHEQYPNVKIIVGLEIYGANSVGFYNKFYNSAYPRKFAQLSLYQKWMQTFENYSHVVFAPIYARMDDVRGYGLMTEIAVNDNVYENPMKEIVRVNGFDGVHPLFDYGQKEIAMTYEPIIISMLPL